MIVCRSRAEIEKLRKVNQLVGTVLAAWADTGPTGTVTAQSP